MISRQRLRQNITAAIHTAQGAGLMTTISLGTYQAIHGIQQYLGDKDPNAIEQLTHVSAGGLIGGVALATTAFILIGDTIDHSREPDSNTYKGVADSPTYKP